ncbi:MAG TPA: contractile injection system protein, VgrG/Pvc8 family, partial [Polyangiaceae bacterium]|nr:contractile injection system protein, VgrG/Pvc8 family [Polyangiaceae bacterium]
MTDDALIRLHCAALPQRPPGSSASGDEEADVALVASYSAEEALSRPYRITVDFSIPAELTSDFVVEDLLRNRASLHVTSAALDRERFFDGIVSEASFERAVGNRLHFRVVLRPSLWLLTLREDARIFQEATAPDIVRTLLGEAGLASTTHWHVGVHPRLQFTVLYKESPLNFIQRLCEDAGIFYYFTHDADGHQLHFSDDTKSFESLGDPVSSSLAQASELATPLVHFRRSLRLRTSEVSLRDFDVDAPHTLPQVSSPIGSPLPQP